MNKSCTSLSGAECNGNWSLTLKKETTLKFLGEYRAEKDISDEERRSKKET